MNGMHVTVLGGIGIIVAAWWIIGHAGASRDVAVGGAQAFGSVARTFNRGTGAK